LAAIIFLVTGFAGAWADNSSTTLAPLEPKD